MRHRGFTGVHWLLTAAALTGAFSACRLNYETLSDAAAGVSAGGNSGGGDSNTGGVEAQGASANAGEPSSGGDGSGTAGSATGGSSDGGAGVDPGGSGGSGGAGGTDTAGTAGAGGSAGSSGSGGSGGSPVGDLIVTTNADENDAGATALAPGGTGLSLREAITIANATSGSQTITFQNGIVVAQTNTLPTVTDAVTISGGEVNAVGVQSNLCLVIAAGPTTVDGLELYNCPGRPLQVTGGNDVHIRNCDIHDNSISVDVAATAGTGTMIGPGNTIRASGNHCLSINNDATQVIGNRITDCDSVGVILPGPANTRVIGNLIARANFGISMGTGTTGTVIWHNTFANCSASGLNVAQGAMNDVRNNIFALNANYGMAATDSRLTQNTHNLFFGNGSGPCNPCMVGANSLQIDPLFVNAAGDDFTLQANSPAINAGASLGVDQNGAAAGDFNGVAPDIGYWESP
jgi:hypothetical protein